MDKYLGKDEKPRYLLEVFAEQRKMEALIGKGFEANTLKGYRLLFRTCSGTLH